MYSASLLLKNLRPLQTFIGYSYLTLSFNSSSNKKGPKLISQYDAKNGLKLELGSFVNQPTSVYTRVSKCFIVLSNCEILYHFFFKRTEGAMLLISLSHF